MPCRPSGGMGIYICVMASINTKNDMRANINLYQGDCMEAMAKMKDNAFDLAIVDPPYKIDVTGLKAGFGRGNFNYKALSNPPTKKYIKELFRISKNQILWGFNYYMNLLPNTDSCIIWNKHQNGHFSEAELAWCSIGKTRIFDRAYQKDIGNKIHPTQKPVALYKWLLKNYAKEGDTILDTHLGSGSIAIACHDMGFDLEAYELDSDYYRDCMKRFTNHTAQGLLF
jgi:site-specific DNA-methyltransferase (adenine-specific)